MNRNEVIRDKQDEDETTGEDRMNRDKLTRDKQSEDETVDDRQTEEGEGE